MSPPPKDRFLNAARARSWKIAYDECNGLNMVDMLDCLQDIGPDLLRDMRAQMPIYDVWGGPNMPRIRFAMDVVELRKIPAPPADLPADQVQNARDFLARRSGRAIAGLKQIRIALFWTEAARTESVSTHLVQRARDLLRNNQAGFDLDVFYYRANIDFKGEVLAESDVDNAIELAKQVSSYAPNRLSVIFCQTTPAQCDPNRQRCGRVPNGSTPRDALGRPFVFINVANPHPDHGTLLHEIGHAAGIDSRDSDDALQDLDDVMSYGRNRSKVGINQINKLNRTGLFFVGR
jgi:hypothetical protein